MREAYYTQYTYAMTETAERAGSNVRRVRTVRMHDGTWDLLQSRRGMIAATLINDMTEAGLGFVRCRICHEPVPVEFGDLTGRPLAEWIDETGKAIKTQHRDGHRPVTIGIRRTGDTGADLAALQAELDQARAALEPLEMRVAQAEARAASAERAEVRAGARAERAEGEAGALVRKLEKAETYAGKLKAAIARESARRAAEAESRRSARRAARTARDRRDRQIVDAARAGQDHGSIAERFGLTKSRIGQIVRDASADNAPPGSAQVEPLSPVFLEPGGTPVIAAAVPEVPASRSKRSR